VTVVATTDGSERSLRIVPHAARLAGVLGEPLVLLRVLDPVLDCGDVVSASLREAIRTVSARWQQELLGALSMAGASGTVEIPVRVHGEESHDTALAAAHDLSASVLALTSRGSGGVRQALFGSMASRLIEGSRVPVLVAGPEAGAPVAGDSYHLFVMSDGSPAAESIVPPLRPLIRDGVRVTFWQALEDGSREEAQRGLERLAAGLPEGTAWSAEVAQAAGPDSVAALAIERAGATGATAMALSAHGRGRRFDALAGTTAMAVIQRSPLPVLTMRVRGAEG
jgi:nucleotide-binding universal stress UspA family protein